MRTKILVTGAAGYIGAILSRKLLDRGHVVWGIDRLLFGGAAIADLHNHPLFHFIEGDIVDPETWVSPLAEVDAVVHLAAIVGDPACSLSPGLARKTNLDASKVLFRAARDGGNVKRFVFSSTCSNYGRQQDEDYCHESTPLAPLSLYAETKVEFENYILQTPVRPDFSPTALRFATAYGLAPRMRFDLTVNEFTREIALGRELEIYGQQFWRPYCHTEDLAEACARVLEADRKLIHQTVFNVGDTDENYTKEQLAAILTELSPSARISYVHKQEDPRDYKVNFDHIATTLSFKITRRVSDGIKEIYEHLVAGTFNDPDADVYNNSRGAQL